ncbi:MAG: nucleoside triphosphate pyrophosphatase [Rothia sp. (in: high G+C Gram-positive bacteria)]|uniref:Maf family protein n=1 Tax=Rothia sp. (in: high G+C Gram-positive bacteria) TaxID=1885016 RepID=UPI0026DF5358|nr:nucleoside triphosphate pyrophosphatase [Rothia sp. (in: high G+C Gram-positive bacteria)]MDO5750330.1 nucleoside triphosphate pyrophosphatase [Rothia sp. (in: high G+C Gram-positive bacteria)]
MSISEIAAAASLSDSPVLVLASASPARRKLLQDSGVRFMVMVSSVDEDAVLKAASDRAQAAGQPALSPAATAQLLAEAKVGAVVAELRAAGVNNALVLGCDSVFEVGGFAYGKPHSPQVARERMSAMSGSHGVLHTGHALIDLREPATEPLAQLRSARVFFDSMTEQEIDAYIATTEPLEVAGSFTLDGYGAAFISRIEGEFHTVVGLSIQALRVMLSERHLAIMDFWVSPTER